MSIQLILSQEVLPLCVSWCVVAARGAGQALLVLAGPAPRVGAAKRRGAITRTTKGAQPDGPDYEYSHAADDAGHGPRLCHTTNSSQGGRRQVDFRIRLETHTGEA